MKVLRYFASRYRAQSLLVLVCILLGGLLDGVGISAMLPVLSIVMRGSSDAPDAESADTSALGKTIDSALESVGLEPSLQLLLPFVVNPMIAPELVSSQSALALSTPS